MYLVMKGGMFLVEFGEFSDKWTHRLSEARLFAHAEADLIGFALEADAVPSVTGSMSS